MAVIAIIVIFIVIAAIVYTQYQSSSYCTATKNSYFSVLNNKGLSGEYQMFRKLSKYEKDGARFLFNCYIPKDNGETTEIDMIMIHRSGIYVFESKNYGGWIFGNEYDKEWTQTLPSGSRAIKEHFFNPIMQNKIHIQWLEKLIGESYHIHSIVVFSNKCTFKSLTVSSPDTYVTYMDYLSDIVEQIDSSWRYITTEEQVANIYNILFPLTQVSDLEKSKHVQDVRRAKYSRAIENIPLTTSDGTLLCPRCNGRLVQRTAQRGAYAGSQFYGCSNYPRCKFRCDIRK